MIRHQIEAGCNARYLSSRKGAFAFTGSARARPLQRSRQEPRPIPAETNWYPNPGDTLFFLPNRTRTERAFAFLIAFAFTVSGTTDSATYGKGFSPRRPLLSLLLLKVQYIVILHFCAKMTQYTPLPCRD